MCAGEIVCTQVGEIIVTVVSEVQGYALDPIDGWYATANLQNPQRKLQEWRDGGWQKFKDAQQTNRLPKNHR